MLLIFPLIRVRQFVRLILCVLTIYRGAGANDRFSELVKYLNATVLIDAQRAMPEGSRFDAIVRQAMGGDVADRTCPTCEETGVLCVRTKCRTPLPAVVLLGVIWTSSTARAFRTLRTPDNPRTTTMMAMRCCT